MTSEEYRAEEKKWVGRKFTCSCCGEEYTTESNLEVSRRLATFKLCFECDYWHEYIKRVADYRNDGSSIRVGGVHYVICPEDSRHTGILRGYGGSRKFIRVPPLNQNHPERIFVTTNLWCQSDIPARFREMLPDNAEFMPYDTKINDIGDKLYVMTFSGPKKLEDYNHGVEVIRKGE